MGQSGRFIGKSGSVAGTEAYLGRAWWPQRLFCPQQTMGRLRTARIILGVLSLGCVFGLVYKSYLLQHPTAVLALPEAQYLVPPKPCDAATKLLVCVFSKPINVENRLAIRETWGQDLRKSGAEIVFLIGRSHGPILQEEIRAHGDIVQENFKDTYYNLALKSLAMVRYAAVHCPSVQHVLKVDDDVLLNTKKFYEAIARLNEPKSIWGNLAHGWLPIRNPNSKWYVPPFLFNGTIFPDFVTGVSYLMSGDSSALLYQGYLQSRYFYLEDVFWTGLVAEKMGIARHSHRGFANTRVFLRACDATPFFMSHGYTAEYLRISWKSLQKRIQLCSRALKRVTPSSEATTIETLKTPSGDDAR